MKEIRSPRPAITRPFPTDARISVAMAARPQMASIRYSGGPSRGTRTVMRGSRATSTITPNVEPNAEAAAEQPSAVFACPACAMGYPSNIVAALGAVPGMFRRMAVAEPMKVAPPTRAPNSSSTGIGSQWSVNGMIRIIMAK